MSESTEMKRPGWVAFAAMILIVAGGIAILTGIVEFIDNSFAYDNSILGERVNVLFYGSFDIIMGAVALYAGYAVWKGQAVGAIIAALVAMISAVRWFLFLPSMGTTALLVSTLWILVLFGLTRDDGYFNK
jgi:hypothetical protein